MKVENGEGFLVRNEEEWEQVIEIIQDNSCHMGDYSEYDARWGTVVVYVVYDELLVVSVHGNSQLLSKLLDLPDKVIEEETFKGFPAVGETFDIDNISYGVHGIEIIALTESFTTEVMVVRIIGSCKYYDLDLVAFQYARRAYLESQREDGYYWATSSTTGERIIVEYSKEVGWLTSISLEDISDISIKEVL